MPKRDKKRANKDKSRKTTIDPTARRPDSQILCDDEQQYAEVLEAKGNRRFLIKLPDGSESMARLAGRIRKRKKNWCNTGMFCIVSSRDFQTLEAKTANGKDRVNHDILDLLTSNEVKYLKKKGLIAEQGRDEDLEDLVEFVDEDEKLGEIDIDEI